jgi:hypothetical protein
LRDDSTHNPHQRTNEGIECGVPALIRKLLYRSQRRLHREVGNQHIDLASFRDDPIYGGLIELLFTDKDRGTLVPKELDDRRTHVFGGRCHQNSLAAQSISHDTPAIDRSCSTTSLCRVPNDDPLLGHRL